MDVLRQSLGERCLLTQPPLRGGFYSQGNSATRPQYKPSRLRTNCRCLRLRYEIETGRGSDLASSACPISTPAPITSKLSATLKLGQSKPHWGIWK